MAVDKQLPARLAGLFADVETTPRGEALVGLVEAARDVIAGAAMVPDAPGPSVALATGPEPALAAPNRTSPRGSGCGGTVPLRRPHRSMASDLLMDLVNALAPEPAPQLSAKPAPWRRWADLVTARRAANARLAIRLDPPAPDTDEAWSLVPLIIALDDPTTRLPAEEASGWASFAALSPETRAIWREAELANLRAAWPKGPMRDLRTYLPTESELIEFLQTRADALQLAGIDVLTPGGLLRPAQVRRRVSASAGTGCSMPARSP